MPDPSPQSLKTHVRYDPLFHFFLLPVFATAVVWSLIHAVRHPSPNAWAFVVFCAAVLILCFKARMYPLKVQSRIIRLEERLRLREILSEPLRSRIPQLTERQLVALRFASDAEIPSLVEQALSQNMTNADIKKAIQNWRADNFRV